MSRPDVSIRPTYIQQENDKIAALDEEQPLDLSVYFNVLSREQLEHLVIKLLMKDDSVFDVLKQDATELVAGDTLVEDIHSAITGSDKDPIKLVTSLEPIAERASSYLQMKLKENASIVLNEITKAFMFFLIQFCEERDISPDIRKDRELSKHMLKRNRLDREGKLNDNMENSDEEDEEEEEIALLEENAVREFLSVLERHWTTFAGLVCAEAMEQSEIQESGKGGDQDDNANGEEKDRVSGGAEKKAFRVLTGPSTSDQISSSEIVLDSDEMYRKLAPSNPLQLFTALAQWYSQLSKYLGPVFGDALRRCKTTMTKLGIKPPVPSSESTDNSSSQMDVDSKATETTIGHTGRPRKTLLKVSK